MYSIPYFLHSHKKYSKNSFFIIATYDTYPRLKMNQFVFKCMPGIPKCIWIPFLRNNNYLSITFGLSNYYRKHVRYIYVFFLSGYFNFSQGRLLLLLCWFISRLVLICTLLFSNEENDDIFPHSVSNWSLYRLIVL